MECIYWEIFNISSPITIIALPSPISSFPSGWKKLAFLSKFVVGEEFLVQVLPPDQPRQGHFGRCPSGRCTEEHEDLFPQVSPHLCSSEKEILNQSVRCCEEKLSSVLLKYSSSRVPGVICCNSDYKHDLLPFPVTCVVLILMRPWAARWNPPWRWCIKGYVPLRAVYMNKSSAHLFSTF